jgi:hypothetical protein
VETFYAALSGICFTLLGLWWVALQLKYDLWMSTPARRLTAYVASMHFVVPGLIALVAVLSTDEAPIWRLGSVLGGTFGVVVSGYAIRAAALTRWQRAQEVIMLGLFMAIIVLSFVTTPLFGLRPIVIEALVDVGLLGVGVHFVWHFLTERSASAP